MARRLKQTETVNEAVKERRKRMQTEGIDFLREYRADPERYLPLPERQYQHFDEWEGEIIRNLCWSAGLLEGNRPYFAEFWKIFGVTSMTVSVFSGDTQPEEIINAAQTDT